MCSVQVSGPVPRRRPGRRSLLAGGLVVAAGVLVAASLASRWLAYRRELASPGIAPPWWMHLLDVNGEVNVPAWFSVVLMATAGAAAAAVALVHRARRPKAALFLAALAVVLLGMSLDEMTGLHERLGGLGERLAGGSPLHFTWVVPGAALAAVVGAGLLVGARALPRRTRRSLLSGLAVFGLGALGAETVSGLVLQRAGDRAGYLLVTAVEEFLEMLGIVLVLRAVLGAVRVERRDAGWLVRPAGTTAAG